LQGSNPLTDSTVDPLLTRGACRVVRARRRPTLGLGSERGLAGGAGVLDQHREFLARTLDDAFEVSHELGVQGVVGCLECFQRLVATADEDAEQRNLLMKSVPRDGMGYRVTRRLNPAREQAQS
jgi:hypothetical protein